jgi:sulfate permease, SulP family
MEQGSGVRRGGAVSIGDVWGGLAGMLVALPSAIAFGVLVFSTIDPSMAGRGALYGMLGAAAMGLVAPLVGGTAGLVSAPCAPAAAVLSGLAALLLAQGVPAERIPGLLILTGLLAAGFQVIYGLARGGRFIKYIPYPVVSGYLSGVGLIIALGQLPKLLGLDTGQDLIDGLMAPGTWRWPGLAVGLVTILAMVLGPRLTNRVPAAVLGLIAGIAVYFLLALAMPGLLVLGNNPLIIGPLKSDTGFIESLSAQAQGLLALQIGDIELVVFSALALSALLSIDTLKTCVVLDALTRRRHNSNRELLGQGVANVAAFAIGGMPGAGTMGPTLVNVTSGGTTRLSGLFEGIFVVLVIVVLAPLIAWVPIGALAGVLLVVAWRMFDWHAFALLRHRDTILDFAVIATVVVVAETVGLIPASAAGIGLAIVLFIRDQIRGSVLRSRATLASISSKTRRLEQERAEIAAHGEEAEAVALQGNLFFGTTDQLFTELERDLARRTWLLLDMRRVQSLDYTAANLFRQMHLRLEERGGGLLLCGLPARLTRRQDIQGYLARIGLVGDHGAVRVFETRDSALEWMEDRILERAGLGSAAGDEPLDLGETALFADLDSDALAELRACIEERAVAAGQAVFRRGDVGDEIFILRQGSVRILLPLPGGAQHHIATFGRGDFFGDMAFLDRGTRSADAIANGDCALYVLSRAEFDRRAADRPALAAMVFARLARVASERLRQADAELTAVEDR